MSAWIASRGTALHGEIAVPGDKSVSHRAVMLGAIAEGTTRIEGFLEGEDTRATAAIFARLGVRIEAASRQALSLFAPEQKLEIALAHCVTGMLLMDLEKFDESEQHLKTSLQLFEELGDRFWTALPLQYLGELRHTRGESGTSLPYLFQSDKISEEFGISFLRYYTLKSIGHAYDRLGDINNQMLYHEKSLAEREALGDKRKIVTALIDLASTYGSIANYVKEFEYADRALQLSQSAQYQLGISRAYRQLGWYHFSQSDMDAALESFQNALTAATASGDQDEIVISLNGVAAAYFHKRDYQKSLETTQQAQRVTGSNVTSTTRLNTLRSAGDAYFKQNNLTETMSAYQQVLSLLEKTYRPGAYSDALGAIASIHFERGQYAEALDYYQRALEVADRYIESQAAFFRTRIGIIHRLMGQNDQARADFEAAIKRLEEFRAHSVTSERWLQTYFQETTRLQPYQEMVDLLLERGQAAEALPYAERAKARGLLEMLTESRTDIRAGVDPKLLEREQTVKAKLNARARQQTALASSRKPQSTELTQEIAALTTELQRVEAEIRANSPRYAALTKPQPLDAKEIQQLLDADTVLLEYALGEKQSWLWMVTPTAVTAHRLPPRAELEAPTTDLYRLLAATERTAETEAKLNQQTQTVSRLLLAPVAAQLGRKRLVIVAAGALEYLPFAALPEPSDDAKNAQPLLANHEVVNLPSASTLAVLRRESAGRRAASKAVAVLADPVFDANDARVKNAARNKPELLAAARSPLARTLRDFRFQPKRLFYSRDEAEAIYAVTPSGAGLKALDFQANRTTATSAELSNYRIVHFATHGLLNGEHPELSGLVLSLVNEKGQAQDGFLRLHEIYNLKLNADLVVLSACQTALGKEVQSEGLIGLTRGFMYAGAPRVVASLWKVDDLATKELMKRFYRAMLVEKHAPATALRTAQLEMMQNKRWQSPFYWAAFTLQGEWK